LIPEFFSNNYRLSQSQQLGLKLQPGVFACKIQVLNISHQTITYLNLRIYTCNMRAI
jgi:hypothetical protein